MSKPFSFGAIDVRLEAESDPRPARAEDDTPFRVLLAADFSGRAARGLVETGAALGESKAFRVDLDSLDATIARLEPQVRLRDGDVIRLRELDDFLPDTLFARIARFATLKDASDADAKRRTTSRPAAGLLDRILDGAPQEEAPVVEAAPDGPTDLMRTILGKQRLPGRSKPPGAASTSSFAGWTSTDRSRFTSSTSRRRSSAPISSRETTSSKTGLHRLLVEKTVGTPGAHPWAAFVVLGSFGPSPSDAEALGRLAKIASKAGTAVLAGAEPGLVGCASLAETPDPDDWTEPTGAGAEAWAALRRLPEARYVGLALPRLLLRLPYGKETNAVEAFDFEELSSPPSHEEYLWGSPALALALLLGEAFLEDGWSLRPGSAQEISGLPFALVDRGRREARRAVRRDPLHRPGGGGRDGEGPDADRDDEGDRHGAPRDLPVDRRAVRGAEGALGVRPPEIRQAPRKQPSPAAWPAPGNPRAVPALPRSGWDAIVARLGRAGAEPARLTRTAACRPPPACAAATRTTALRRSHRRSAAPGSLARATDREARCRRTDAPRKTSSRCRPSRRYVRRTIMRPDSMSNWKRSIIRSPFPISTRLTGALRTKCSRVRTSRSSRPPGRSAARQRSRMRACSASTW